MKSRVYSLSLYLCIFVWYYVCLWLVEKRDVTSSRRSLMWMSLTKATYIRLIIFPKLFYNPKLCLSPPPKKKYFGSRMSYFSEPHFFNPRFIGLTIFWIKNVLASIYLGTNLFNKKNEFDLFFNKNKNYDNNHNCNFTGFWHNWN